jgi:hypothetical protein
MIKALLLYIQYLWHNVLLIYSYTSSVSIKSCLIFAKFARRERSSMNLNLACRICLSIDELNSLRFFLEMQQIRKRCYQHKKTSIFHCHSKINKIRQKLSSIRVQYICRSKFAIIIKKIFFDRTMLESTSRSFWIVIIEESPQYKMRARCSRLKQDDQGGTELNDLIKCVCIFKECYLQMFEILSSHDVYRICLFDRSLIVIISWHLFRIESKSLVSKSTIMLIEFMWAMMTCIERWDFFWLEDRAFEMFETIFHWDRIDRRQSFAMRIILRHDVLWFLECNEVFV